MVSTEKRRRGEKTVTISSVPAKCNARRLAVALSVMVLGGCATFSKDGGCGAVEQTARERLHKEVRWQRADRQRESVQATVKKLLASPLSADDAVQVALFGNPGLQATYADLGIAERALAQDRRGERWPRRERLLPAPGADPEFWSGREAAGNFSRLDGMREQVFHAETVAD